MYKKTYAPDGREAYSIDCSGMALNWGYCMSKAGELCGTNGYDIITKQSDQGYSSILTEDSNIFVNRTNGYGISNTSAMSGSVISRNILISCK